MKEILKRFDDWGGEYLNVAGKGVAFVNTSLNLAIKILGDFLFFIFSIIVLILAFPAWLIGKSMGETEIEKEPDENQFGLPE